MAWNTWSKLSYKLICRVENGGRYVLYPLSYDTPDLHYRPVTEVYFVNSANNKKYVISYEGQLKGETQEAGQVWASVTYMAQTAE